MNFNNPEIVAQVFNFLIDKNYKSVKQDKYITVLNYCPTVGVRVQCFVTLPLDTNTNCPDQGIFNPTSLLFHPWY